MYKEGISGTAGELAHFRYSPEDYDDRELLIYPKENRVVYKQWFDPGKDPNKESYTLDGFAKMIRNDRFVGYRKHFGSIPAEVKEKIVSVLEELGV